MSLPLRPPLPLLLAAALAACTVGPDFHPPKVAAPGVWGPERTDVPSRTVAAAVDPDWWESFNDPELTSLVHRLAAQNIGLQAAMERILQAQSQRVIAQSRGLPQINEQSHYLHERLSPRGFASLIEPAPGQGLEYDDWQNGLSGSWELDLFGRVRRAVEASNAQALAAVDARRGIAVSALAELAQDYLQLRGVQARLAITANNLALAQENLRLTQNRLANGVATTLEQAQATGQVETVAGQIPPLRAQQAALINAIGLLLAEPPRALETELSPPAPIPAVPPEVPVGLPATLVRRRPDVAEAEARLHAATAQTGVAVADFYPDVSLTGSFNLDGREIRDAFSLPDRAYQVGPQISVPIFEGRRLRGELHLRQAQQREAALRFHQTVLQAWQDVDNALTAYAEAQAQRKHVARAVSQSQVALTAARQQYQQGAADFLNVVTSQAQLLQTQDDLATSDTMIDTDLVALYRALGGGWQVTETGQAEREARDVAGEGRWP